MMKNVLLASAALTLAACASAPHDVATLTQMPSAYDYAGEMAGSEKNEGDWWKSFSDPALDALIADALAANQDIKAGLAAVESSRASVQVSKAALFPQASGGVSGSSNSETGLDDVSGSARASASWELDLFGQNRAALAASRANLDAQVFDQRALELSVQSDVAFNYFSTLALRKQLEVARSNLEISERIYSIVKTRYDAGYVSGFDVASQEASLANARARLPQLERQLAGYEMALAILLGRTPQGYDAPEGDLLATTPPDEVDRALDGRLAPVMAGGHTHLQLVRQHRGALLVNPGSVGLPILEYVAGRAPTVLDHAEYAIVDAAAGAASVSLCRIPLDRRALRAQAESTDHPLRAMLAAAYA